ncbi:MAG: hypothetical protein J7L15_01495 [Clostridiales bacterium]|nr:hypothetical protein [Clostridiales bacterium]
MQTDQERICSICEDIFGVGRDTCQEDHCQRVKNIYYRETKGTEYSVPFDKLRLGDEFFVLNVDLDVPKVLTAKVKSMKDTSVNVCLYEKGGKSYTIPKDVANKSNYRNLFTSKKDCNKRLEEVCIEKIVELSKVIGNIQHDG